MTHEDIYEQVRPMLADLSEQSRVTLDSDEDRIVIAYYPCLEKKLYVWSQDGKTSLGTVAFQETDEDKESALQTVTALIDDYLNKDIIKCSCCRCSMLAKGALQTGRRYFAGIYCIDCWETTYKEMEANETYD